MTTTWYRIQQADSAVDDLLDPAMQYSHCWSATDDDDDPSTRRGVSVCDSLESLAGYLAGSGIPFGCGQWVVVALTGPQSDDVPLEADKGEHLVLPDAIVSVTPMGPWFLDLVGAAYDAMYA